jgi:outer membrane lipoprotein SlyB
MAILSPNFRTAALALALSAGLAGCAPPYGPDRYYRFEAQRAQSVEFGVVEDVRPLGLNGPT